MRFYIPLEEIDREIYLYAFCFFNFKARAFISLFSFVSSEFAQYEDNNLHILVFSRCTEKTRIWRFPIHRSGIRINEQ